MPPAVPRATYRLQLTSRFTFDDAAAVVPYLASLGISHVYASPFLQARAGSTHGYDVTDYGVLNPELGGASGFARLAAALARAQLGLILDFVPNHMAVNGADNRWWLDVLEWGPASPHAASFDIDWRRLHDRPRGAVLLPLLGRPYHEALAAGEIELRFDPREGSFSAWYFEHRLPIAPQGYGAILRRLAARNAPAQESVRQQIRALAARNIASRTQAEALKAALASDPGVRDFIARGLCAYRPEDLQSTRALHRLLERQHYRLAHWRLASTAINYRRFFDINSLAALRMENPSTFAAAHQLAFDLVKSNQLHGLRLDHIDGLWDPYAYCEQLRHAICDLGPDNAGPFYTIVEKILEPDEPQPSFPGCAGTTGYEWLNLIARVLADGAGLPGLSRTWTEFSGEVLPFSQILRTAKRFVLANVLASEFAALTDALARIAAGHHTTRDFAPSRLRAALEMFVLCFPVYRTYVTPARSAPSDRRFIEDAISAARREWQGPADGIFDFLQALLTLDLIAPGRCAHSVRRAQQFVGKLQQFTGPLMAKSLEDTAFYRYHAVLALTEVGGRPDAPALSVDAFHARMAGRAADVPHGLTATATHDTKRGEDARARLLALSELPDEWHAIVGDWSCLNAGLIKHVQEVRVPSAAHEYLFYQALLGALPFAGVDQGFTERMQAFMLKAAREGKEQTSWLDPDPNYERGLADFVHAALDRRRSNEFLTSLKPFAERIARLGALNSLSQLALKIALPGVPDIYQGTEFWDLSFVDPDNRRPVDFATRSRVAGREKGRDWSALAEGWQSGEIKLALLQHLLEIRRDHAELFTSGDYRPIAVRGLHAPHVIAFARSLGEHVIIIALGRLFAPLTQGGRRWPQPSDWQGEIAIDGYDAAAPLGPSSPACGGSRITLANLFGALPVGLLKAKLAR